LNLSIKAAEHGALLPLYETVTSFVSGFHRKHINSTELHTPKLFWVRKYSLLLHRRSPSEHGGDSLSMFIQRAIEVANRQNDELHTKKHRSATMPPIFQTSENRRNGDVSWFTGFLYFVLYFNP
jgi:hypothetical protein